MKTKKKNRVWISARISPEAYKFLSKEAKKIGSKGLALDDMILEYSGAIPVDRSYYNA